MRKMKQKKREKKKRKGLRILFSIVFSVCKKERKEIKIAEKKISKQNGGREEEQIGFDTSLVLNIYRHTHRHALIKQKKETLI